MSEVHAADREHLVPISAKVPSELADAVSRLADAGDRSVSREVYRALRMSNVPAGHWRLRPARIPPSAAPRLIRQPRCRSRRGKSHELSTGAVGSD
jgi:hypothetical protein